MTAEPLRPVTAEEIARFRDDGVVCLRGIVPVTLVRAMEEPVERVLGSGEAPDLAVLAPDGEATAAFFGGVDHWRSDGDFRALACDSPLPAIAAALLGSSGIWLYEDSLLVKEPGSSLRTEFHTDAGYFHVAGDQVCTFWVPLDPASAESGAVSFVRGSHRWPVDYRPNLFVTDEPIPGTDGEPVPDVLGDPTLAERLVTFELGPGDLTVHHYRTLHGAPANRSADRRRRAISVRYCGDDARYHLRPGAPRKPHQHAVHDGDPLGGPDCPQVWPPAAAAHP
ncbi:MAG: phytanoyl-CoA dioxygenase family protein [Acidimicrobiales bacterium]|jgi:ectoine hydroxylase-related dioxygenase (phytanoyl-CoA dioxygenase family)|nr:phytanoyl-CoA dioxygenase family protein [Acidimicrobiales bacterium]